MGRKKAGKIERKKEKDESRQNDHIDRLIASNNMEARMRIAHKNVNKKIEERWASLRVDTTQLSDITQVINKTISVQHQGLIDEVRNAVAAIDKFGDEFKTIKYDFKLNLANFIKAHMDIVAEFRDDQVKMMRLHREDPQSFMDKYEAELRDEEMAKFFPGIKREMARNPSIANQTLESTSLQVSVSSQGISSQPVTHHIKQLDEAALVIDERERIFETDVARLNTLWEKVNNFVYAEHMKFIKESSTIMLLLEKYETNCLAHNAYKNQVLQHIKFFTDLHAHMVGNYFELSAEIITSQREKITRLANGDRTVLDEKEEAVMKNDSLPIDAIGVVDELISDIANHVKNSTHKETPDDYVHFLVSSSSKKVAETPGCSVFADQPSSSVTDNVTSMTDNQETNSKEQATTTDRNAGNPDLNAAVSNGTRGKKINWIELTNELLNSWINKVFDSSDVHPKKLTEIANILTYGRFRQQKEIHKLLSNILRTLLEYNGPLEIYRDKISKNILSFCVSFGINTQNFHMVCVDLAEGYVRYNSKKNEENGEIEKGASATKVDEAANIASVQDKEELAQESSKK